VQVGIDALEEAVPFDWAGLVAEAIAPGIQVALAEADAAVDRAVALPVDASFDAVFGELDGASRAVGRAYGRYAFPERVHPDPDVRAAASDAGAALEQWWQRTLARDDVAALIERLAAVSHELGSDRTRLVDAWHRDVADAGRGLTRADRERLQELRQVTIAAPGRFFPALARPVRIAVAPDELVGLPEAVVAILGTPAEDGSIDVTLSDPIVTGVLESAPHRGLRERVSRAWLTRGWPDTTQVMDDLSAARRGIARLLGAGSRMEQRAPRLAMGGTDRVRSFLAEVEPPLARQAATELEAMRLLLVEETGDPDAVVEEWDWRYLDARQRGREGVDPTQLRPYLPFETVLDGLWQLSERVFGVRVEARPERRGWHEDVRAFDMVDRDTGRLIAELLVDPYARAGKASNAYMDTLDPGKPGVAGRPPVMMLGVNAPKPVDGPSTLTFVDIDQLFHEYGHVLDFALDRSLWFPRETWIEFDYVEGPSLFLGRWGQHPDVLRTFARHVLTGEPIPEAVFEGLAKLEALNSAFKAMRFLSMARLDMLLHGEEAISAADADRRAWELRGIPFVEGTSFVGTFLHLVGGYDAAIYGFLWDQALRDDLFVGFGPDLLSPAAGARYRETILEAPWTQPPVERVAVFLGRPWSTEALLDRTGAP
jgi:Zn-dependent oligopeptidase